MALDEVIRRDDWTIVAIVKSGRCQVAEFIDGLADERDRKKVAALVNYVAAKGPPSHNKQMSNPLRDGLFEFKPTNQVRFLYFYDGPKRVVITHALRKKVMKMRREDIERGLQMRSEYSEARRLGKGSF